MRNLHEQHSYQFHYFSPNYIQFEEDFYTYAKTSIPLCFLSDDLLRSMVAMNQTFFRLNPSHTKDQKIHVFLFEKKVHPTQDGIYSFNYIGHKTIQPSSSTTTTKNG